MRVSCCGLKYAFVAWSKWWSEWSQSSMTMHRLGGSTHAPISVTTLG
jgi:hypothetical protein